MKTFFTYVSIPIHKASRTQIFEIVGSLTVLLVVVRAFLTMHARAERERESQILKALPSLPPLASGVVKMPLGAKPLGTKTDALLYPPQTLTGWGDTFSIFISSCLTW